MVFYGVLLQEERSLITWNELYQVYRLLSQCWVPDFDSFLSKNMRNYLRSEWTSNSNAIGGRGHQTHRRDLFTGGNMMNSSYIL